MARRSSLTARLAALAISVAAAALIAWIAAPRLSAWRWRETSAESFSELRACLIGSSRERAADERLRAMAVTASLAPAPGDWPLRCDERARQLAFQLERLALAESERCADGNCCPGDQRCESLLQLRHLVVTASEQLRSRVFSDGAIAALLDRGRELGLERELPAALEPPSPARVPVAVALTPLHRGRAADLLTDPPAPDGLELLFFEERRGYGWCELPAALDRARCRTLPAEVPAAKQGWILAGEPGAPSLVAAAGEAAAGGLVHAVYDAATGARRALVPAAPRGGFAWRSGRFVLLTPAAPNGPALYWSDAREQELELPETVTLLPELVGSAIVWGERGSSGGHRLVARDLGEDGTLGPPVPLGESAADAGTLTLSSCHGGEALAALWTGQPRGHESEVAIAFRSAEGWHRLARQRVATNWFGFTCRGRRAQLSWIEALAEETAPGASDTTGGPLRGRYGLRRLACEPAGDAVACREERGEVLLERYARSSRYLLVDFGERVAVVWRSPLGDVRMRTGGLADLDGAPEVPLFDEPRYRGFAWEIERGAVFARQGAAVLIARAADATAPGRLATYALRLAEDGSVAPIAVEER